ncbi:hypothetical protein GCM10022271_08740 [Corallibacter vietnamensis]|uniref:Uncharacterized protein n=1 Tax=Corallibacter vietnamensis TaxID=904130 RepID=A0ABP7GYN9_9FLAO
MLPSPTIKNFFIEFVSLIKVDAVCFLNKRYRNLHILIVCVKIKKHSEIESECFLNKLD